MDPSKKEKGTKFFDDRLCLQLRNFDRENVNNSHLLLILILILSYSSNIFLIPNYDYGLEAVSRAEYWLTSHKRHASAVRGTTLSLRKFNPFAEPYNCHMGIDP